MKPNSIQSRYILPILSLGLGSILFLGLVLSKSIQNVIEAEMYSALRMSGDAASAMVEQRLIGLRERMQDAAGDETFRSFDAEAIKKRAGWLIRVEPALLSVYVMTVDGTMVFSADGGRGEQEALRNEFCFEQVRRSERGCFSDMRVNGRNETLSYLFVPIMGKSGRTLGVVAAAINLHDKQFTSPINTLNPGRGGFAYLADGAGNTIVSGEPSAQRRADRVENKAVDAARAGGRGQIEYSYEGRRMLAQYMPIEQTGWTMVVQRPKSEIRALARKPIGWVSFALLLATAGLVALIVVQTQSITRFVFSMRTRMRAVAAGDEGVEIFPADRNDEFSEFYAAFNDMLKTLRRDREALETRCKASQSEVKFGQALGECFQDILFVADAAHKVRFLNEAARKSLPGGADALDRDVETLGAGWSGREVLNALSKAMAAGRKTRVEETPCKLADGSSRFFEIDVHPFPEPVEGRRMALAVARDVTDAAMQKGAVKTAEQRVRKFANAIPAALVTLDESHRVTWANREAMALFQTGPSGLVGSFLKDWPTPSSKAAVEQGLAAAFGRADSVPFQFDLKAGDETTPVEVRIGMIHLDDRTREALAVLRPIPARPKTMILPAPPAHDMESRFRQAQDRFEHAQGQIVDAREARAHLERRLRFFSSAIDAAPPAFLVADESGKILHANRSCEKCLGYPKAQALGKNLTVVFPEWKGDRRLEKIRREIAEKGWMQFESNARKQDGQQALCAVSVARFKPDQESGRSLLFLVTDITAERKKENDRVYMERRALVENACRLISQRIQPPIGQLRDSILRLSDSIIMTNTTRAIFDDMTGNLKRLAHSQNNLYQYASFKKPDFELTDLRDLIRRTLEALEKHGVLSPGVRLEAAVEESLPKTFMDPELMMMAIWNLTLNAAQSITGPGVIRVGAADYSNEKDPFILVEVADTGRGIPNEELPHVFEPFYSRTPGGIGLGLPLARKAVEAHSGRIEIESAEGAGAKAYFSIPIFKR